MQKPRLTFWKLVVWAVMAPGLYALAFRFTHGLGASTNLSDDFPWGLWVGFKLFAIALAGGGFTLAAVVHIFNLERYRPVLRPMILTAFLSYSMFIASLIIDLGRPYRVWHPLVMWNHRSVMFEIAWCVMLYTTVLCLEFLPVVLERLGWHRQLRWMHTIMVPLVIAGGKKLPELDALKMAYEAVNEGAAGVDMGRNIFQCEAPAAMIQAVRAVVHGNEIPEKAYDFYLSSKTIALNR